MMSLAWSEYNDVTKPPSEKIKVYFEHYGCTANRFDSEIILGLISSSNFLELVNSPQEADIVIINTCIVKGPTQRKMEKRINYFVKELKKKVIVAGCFGQALKEYLLEKYSNNISIVGCYNINKILDAIIESYQGKSVVYTNIEVTASEKIELPKLRFNPIVGIVVICDGCIGNCHYCIVKLARGWLNSVDKEKIVKYIKHMVEKENIKEILLTAQDTGIYGLDKGYTLSKLIKEILNSTDKFFKMRIGMMNPKAFLIQADELLDCFEDERLFRFLHLPVQSGSDKILKAMNRPYTVEEYYEAVKLIRNFDQYFNIITDIIVGYPLETEEDFLETVKLVEETQPDNVFLSRFEARPFTRALEFKQLPGWKIKQRSRELIKIIHKISLRRNLNWVGKTTKIIVDNEPDARNDYYKVVITGGRFKLGEIKEVKIRSANHQQLYI